jgi:hypothetical protein
LKLKLSNFLDSSGRKPSNRYSKEDDSENNILIDPSSSIATEKAQAKIIIERNSEIVEGQ